MDVGVAYGELAAAELFAELEPGVDDALDVPLQAPSKVAEHGRTSRQDDVLVEWPTHVDRAVLNDRVHNLRDRRCKVRVGELDWQFAKMQRETIIINLVKDLQFNLETKFWKLFF